MLINSDQNNNGNDITNYLAKMSEIENKIVNKDNGQKASTWADFMHTFLSGLGAGSIVSTAPALKSFGTALAVSMRDQLEQQAETDANNFSLYKQLAGLAKAKLALNSYMDKYNLNKKLNQIQEQIAGIKYGTAAQKYFQEAEKTTQQEQKTEGVKQKNKLNLQMGSLKSQYFKKEKENIINLRTKLNQAKIDFLNKKASLLSDLNKIKKESLRKKTKAYIIKMNKVLKASKGKTPKEYYQSLKNMISSVDSEIKYQRGAIEKLKKDVLTAKDNKELTAKGLNTKIGQDEAAIKKYIDAVDDRIKRLQTSIDSKNQYIQNLYKTRQTYIEVLKHNGLIKIQPKKENKTKSATDVFELF